MPCSAWRSGSARTGRAGEPYWAQHALTFEDPDGFLVVLAGER
jgi:YycE-like protein